MKPIEQDFLVALSPVALQLKWFEIFEESAVEILILKCARLFYGACSSFPVCLNNKVFSLEFAVGDRILKKRSLVLLALFILYSSEIV